MCTLFGIKMFIIKKMKDKLRVAFEIVYLSNMVWLEIWNKMLNSYWIAKLSYSYHWMYLSIQ